MQNSSEAQVTFEDLVLGQGSEALKGALCLIQYTGTLENGNVFDSTEKHGRPFQFVVGSKKVIKGLSLGMVGMKVGGQRRLFIPAELAYGERSQGLIPPHSNLIFHIELLEALNREE